MKIIEKNIDSLTPYHNNPRNNENAVEPVAASIREFGFKIPIIIDSDGVIAAEQTGRTCFTAELDPRYCDVIVKRWENLTGEKAVKL